MKYVISPKILELSMAWMLLWNIVHSQTTGSPNRKASPGDFPSSDPRLSLQGQCVVVCDALTTSPQHPYLPTSSSRRIAFSVGRKTPLGSPDDSDSRVITFDYIFVNVGSAFDSATSTFISPVAGVYSFDFNIYKFANSYSVTVALTVNGAAQFVGESNSAPHGLARNSGITYLNANDKVRIEILKGHLEGGWKDSTFSGYLLYEERL